MNALMEKPIDIGAYHEYGFAPGLASSAQPTSGQLAGLKDFGFEAVVNISPSSTRNAVKDEAEVVETAGLDYVHFPVDCSKLRPLHYLTFRGILNALEGKKVLIHCGGNIKSSNLLHMYFTLEKEIPEELSLAELKAIQDPETKWFDFFKSMGMRALA
jgi:protein tyrosine phosphatase (PTP) superfamily phosphohydrolase (DUF442 family)